MSVTVVDLVAEHRGAGPFVATATPRLSWRVATGTPGWYQASYEIELAGDLEQRTGPIASGDSVLVPLAGGAAGIAPARDLLRSRHRHRRGDERLERAAPHLCATAGGRRLVSAVHLPGRGDGCA